METKSSGTLFSGSPFENRTAEELMFCEVDIENQYVDEFESFSIPTQITDGFLCICLEGEADFLLDLKNYKVKKGDLCVAFPFSFLQTSGKSDDFKLYILAVNNEVVKDIQIPSLTDYYMYIKDNPCISISETEQTKLLQLCELMMRQYQLTEHPFRNEIARSLFKVLYYEIAAIYKKGKPIAREAYDRKDSLVGEFMMLVAKNYHQHREVEHYARQLCITPRYLSSVVKQKTGLSALQWITAMVMKEAKTLLNDQTLTIMQIADQLNFPNPSFFGQYFKKHAGITPKKYRDNKT